MLILSNFLMWWYCWEWFRLKVLKLALKINSTNDLGTKLTHFPCNKLIKIILYQYFVQAIAPLLDFLASNLQILGDYLLTPVLQG